ncbi:helix-turn-helix domain-containing protein [Nitrosomonas communis]|uniref:helix-turn-helix domain-containing protein n=1 Tax=Nitrosomonas communis TaxID=44574 RepID=UPI003D2841BC
MSPSKLLNMAPLLTRQEAADYLGVSPATLSKWACEKTQALPYVKVGRLVRYRIEDLEAYIAESSVNNL